MTCGDSKNNKNGFLSRNLKIMIIVLLGLALIFSLPVSILGAEGGEDYESFALGSSRGRPENIPPHANITHPKNEAEVSGVINITGHAWDTDGNVTDVKVRIAEVNYNATDSTTNNSWYSWFLVFDTTILKNGEYKVIPLPKDDDNDLNDIGWIWIVVNNTEKENQAPTIWIEVPANNSVVSGEITFKGHAKDDGGVKSVDFEIDGKEYLATDTSGNETWWSWKLVFNTTILENGGYWVTAWAWDKEENKGGYDKIYIIVNNTKAKENHWPYVTITHPKNEATVKGTITIKGHAWDNDGNVTLVQVRIAEVWYNATHTTTNSSWYNWSLNFDTTKLKDGEFKVTAIAKDDGGKFGDWHIWIIIKNTKENHWPYVNITQPKNEETVKGVITIKGHAWDPDGNVTIVQVKIGDVWYNATDDSGNNSWYKWSFKYNTTKLEDGEHRIVAISKDDGGKLGDYGRWIIVKNKVENKAPYIQITQPVKDATVKGIIKIKGKAWDLDGKVIKVRVRINEVWYNATDDSGNGTLYYWSVDFNTSTLKDGEYKITAVAWDNKEKAEDIHIWVLVKNAIENLRPKIWFNTPKSGYNVSGNVNISGGASDEKAVQYVQVRIGDKKFNATDSSGNSSWYSWYYIWNTSGYEDGEYRLTALVFDGKLFEDAHVEVNLNNTSSEKNESSAPEEEKKDKEKSSWFLPGFEGPFALAAIVSAVVVAFFRNRRDGNRTK
jgi:PDZ domain-containing secreted protein